MVRKVFEIFVDLKSLKSPPISSDDGILMVESVIRPHSHMEIRADGRNIMDEISYQSTCDEYSYDRVEDRWDSTTLVNL